MPRKTLLLGLVFAVLAMSGVSAQTVIYVDADATGAETGASWEDAYTSLQDALDDASQSSDEVEIWVAAGTYFPTNQQNEDDPRTATFWLTDEVEIYGGFDGSESTREERDPNPATNETILSGDIGSRDFRGDNAYHVVTDSNAAAVIVDGFTITGGNATESGHRNGAGMLIEEGSSTLKNCLFETNSAASDGGGLYTYRSSLTVTDCTFRDNESGLDGGAIRNSFSSYISIESTSFIENEASLGGGAVSNLSSSPHIVNSDFVGNTSDLSGGAIENASSSNPTVLNTRFAGNVADFQGGAIHNRESSPYLSNVLLTGNRADDGGSMYNESSSPTLVNVTISGNLADDGFNGGDGGAVYSDDQSGARFRNAVLWNNDARGNGSQVFIASGPLTPSFGHSLIEGGLPSEAEDEGNNISQDPVFEMPIDPESAPTVEGDFRVLTDGAPVLDHGSNAHLPPDSLDLDGDGDTSEVLPHDYSGADRIVDNNDDATPTVDVGAYEAPSSVIPVELVVLKAEEIEAGALLTWKTASETDNAGFEVQRRTAAWPDSSWTDVRFIDGQGTTSAPQTYRFEDTSLPYGAERAEYRLKQIDADGTFAHSPVVNVELASPTKVILHDNFPNPFREETTIRYEIPERGRLTISVYNSLGQRVKKLIDGKAPAGKNELILEASGLASGIYFVRLQTPQQRRTQKISVIR